MDFWNDVGNMWTAVIDRGARYYLHILMRQAILSPWHSLYPIIPTAILKIRRSLEAYQSSLYLSNVPAAASLLIITIYVRVRFWIPGVLLADMVTAAGAKSDGYDKCPEDVRELCAKCSRRLYRLRPGGPVANELWQKERGAKEKPLLP
jgi:hypothetical protein